MKKQGFSLVGALMLIVILSSAMGAVMKFFQASNQAGREIFSHQEIMETYLQLASFVRDRDLLRRGYDPLVDLNYLYPQIPDDLYKDHKLLQACARRDHDICNVNAFRDREFDYLLLRPQSHFVTGQNLSVQKPVAGTRKQPVLYQADGVPCDYPQATASEECPLQAWVTYRLVCASSKTNCRFPEEVLFRLTFSNATDSSGESISFGFINDRKVAINHINMAEEIRIPLESPRILVTVSQIGGEIQNCLRLRLNQNGRSEVHLLCGYPLACEEECNHVKDVRRLAKSTPHQWVLPVEPGSCELSFEFLSFVPSKAGGRFSACYQSSPKDVDGCRSNPSAHCYGNTRPCGLYLYRPKTNSVEQPFASEQGYVNPVPKNEESLLTVAVSGDLPNRSDGTVNNQKLHVHKLELENKKIQYLLSFEDGSYWPGLSGQAWDDSEDYADYVALIEGDLNHCKTNLDDLQNTTDLRN
jgi:hypothetical protein